MTATPYYEVTAHIEGEPGEAVLTLWTPWRREVVRHIRRWEKDGYDVMAHHITEDGRVLIYMDGWAS